MINNIDTELFNTLMESKETFILDFYAPWCGPCSVIGETLKEISDSDKYSKVNIYKCDIDSNCDEIVSKFGIRNIPTIVFIKNGEVVNRLTGAHKKDVIENCIDELLFK